jgi:hypothetical protein
MRRSGMRSDEMRVDGEKVIGYQRFGKDEKRQKNLPGSFV